MSQSARSQLSKIRRPVIKIGSAVLAGTTAGAAKSGPRLDRARFAALCDDVAALRQPAGKGPPRAPTVVSSGAVALGVERLGLFGKPKEMALKQAAAAVGSASRRSARRARHAGPSRPCAGSAALREARRVVDAGRPRRLTAPAEAAGVDGRPAVEPCVSQMRHSPSEWWKTDA